MTCARVLFDAVVYENSAQNIVLNLGQLTFTRRKRFSAPETRLLEDLLCSLVYPLRNALLYHAALKAAFMCPLTGVNNRATMSTTFNREIEMARHQRALPGQIRRTQLRQTRGVSREAAIAQCNRGPRSLLIYPPAARNPLV